MTDQMIPWTKLPEGAPGRWQLQHAALLNGTKGDIKQFLMTPCDASSREAKRDWLNLRSVASRELCKRIDQDNLQRKHQTSAVKMDIKSVEVLLRGKVSANGSFWIPEVREHLRGLTELPEFIECKYQPGGRGPAMILVFQLLEMWQGWSLNAAEVREERYLLIDAKPLRSVQTIRQFFARWFERLRGKRSRHVS